MDIDHLSDRILARIEDLRDRSAEAVKADGESVFRELSGLRDQLSDTEDRIGDRLDQLGAEQGERLGALIASLRRTTWPRRLWWFGIGLAAGATVSYLADPDRGRARRAQLSDQAAARARDVRDELAGRAEHGADLAQGAAVEAVTDALPEDVPDNPKLLEQRIRSHVFGARNDIQDVVLRIDAPGHVALKGTVPSSDAERSLVSEVAQVEGVLDVVSELSIRGV